MSIEGYGGEDGDIGSPSGAAQPAAQGVESQQTADIVTIATRAFDTAPLLQDKELSRTFPDDQLQPLSDLMDGALSESNLETRNEHIKNIVEQYGGNAPRSARNPANFDNIQRKVIDVFNAGQHKEILVEKAKNVIVDFVNNTLEIEERVLRDQEAITEAFSSSGCCQPLFTLFRIELSTITTNRGETHRLGQTTCFLVLKRGLEMIEVVYKPRDIRIDKSIVGSQDSSLFSRFNRASQERIFDTYKFVDCHDQGGRYGYVEKIQHTDASTKLSEGGARRVLRKLGCAEGVAKLFLIEDLHHENIIIVGERIFFIDLEAFCRVPDIALPPAETESRETGIKVTMRLPSNEKRCRCQMARLALLRLLPWAGAGRERFIEGFTDQCFAQFFEGYSLAFKNKGITDEFIRDLKEIKDLNVRFIPIGTSKLRNYLLYGEEGQLYNSILDSLRKTVDESSGIISWIDDGTSKLLQAVDSAILHHDIPSFEMNLEKGIISCYGIPILKVQGDILNYLGSRVQSYQPLTKNEFKESWAEPMEIYSRRLLRLS